MARKRNTALAPPQPAPAEPAAPTVVDTKVVDMPIRDLLQMLGRTLPEKVPLHPRTLPALPAGIDAEAKLADLSVGDLLQLLAVS